MFFHRAIFSFSCVILLICGCSSEPEPDPDPLDQGEIDSMEAIEAQIHEIERTVRERDAGERVYHHLFTERDAILEIAEGEFNSNSPLHRALIREMSWVILGELRERRPEFEIRITRERDVPSATEPPPASESKAWIGYDGIRRKAWVGYDPDLPPTQYRFPHKSIPEKAVKKLPEEFK